MPIEELLEFERSVLIPAVKRTKQDNLEAKVGKYCRYLCGRAICSKRAEVNKEVIQDLKKPVQTMTDKEIEALLPHLDEVIQYAKDVMDLQSRK